MGNIKGMNIKSRTYYFFDDMINIKNFDSNLLKIDTKSYKHIGIYYIGYVTTKILNMRIFIMLILCISLLIKWMALQK